MKLLTTVLTAALLTAPALADVSKDYRGATVSEDNAWVCTSFTEWLALYDAAQADALELVEYHFEKPNTNCIVIRGGVTMYVTDQSEKWVEVQIKVNEKFIKAYTHRNFIDAKAGDL